jgi:hypothetical protein
MRVLSLTGDDADPQWYMDDMGQQLFEPPNVSGWRPNDYWLTTSRLWARANFARHLVWVKDVQHTLADIVDMSVADAVQHGFDFFGIDNASDHTRSKLEAWLTGQRGDKKAWGNWSFINLTTLLMLTPEFNLA